MDPAVEHKEEMENNLISSRKATIALIPKPHEDSKKKFFKEKRKGKGGKKRGDFRKFSLKNMSEIINKILADIIQQNII